MSQKKRFSASQISAIRYTGITKVVTWQTFWDYFDADGKLRDTVTDSALIFQGKFDGDELNIHRIIIDREISIIGDIRVLEASFRNIAIEITASNVTIDGLAMKATVPLGDLIGVRCSGVSIANMKLEYRCGEESANVISISGEETLQDVVIRNNRIVFVSYVPDDTHHAMAINMDDARDLRIEGNHIRVSIPALVAKHFSKEYFMMGLSTINTLRLRKVKSAVITDNTLRVMVNSRGKKYISCHVIYIAGSEDILIEKNAITLKDTLTPQGSIIAICGVQCGYSKDVRFIENRFDLATRGGVSTGGALQGINHTDGLNTEIRGNTFYCNSRGPVSALFLTGMKGLQSNVSVSGNSIEVSGYAKDDSPFALVSGVELQNTCASICDNTIYVSNKNKEYSSAFPVVGVGYIQRLAGEVSCIVRGNTIRTNGEYTICTANQNVRDVTVTGNDLAAAKREGDDSVKIAIAESCLIENPKPTRSTSFRSFMPWRAR